MTTVFGREPKHGRSAYGGMDAEALYELLRQDYAEPDERSDTDVILAVSDALTALEDRAPAEREAALDAAWASFVSDYLPYPDEALCAPAPVEGGARRHGRLSRRAGIVAAAAAAVLLLGTLVSYAAGFDGVRQIVRRMGIGIPVVTATPAPTETPPPEATPVPTDTPAPTDVPAAASPAPVRAAAPAPTDTPEPTPTATPEPTPAPTSRPGPGVGLVASMSDAWAVVSAEPDPPQSGTLGESIRWEVSEDRVLTVSGTGAMPVLARQDYPWPDDIRRVVIAEGVTSVGDAAFENRSDIAGVTLAGSVKSIGAWAFAGCWGLKELDLPEGLTEIGDHAFSSCLSLGSVTLPQSLTTVGSYAFSSCMALGRVTLPPGLTTLGASAFFGCDSLSEVTIPDSLREILSGTFMGTGLSSVTIPEGVETIGRDAFHGCHSLTSVSLPSTLKLVDLDAFLFCDQLSSADWGGTEEGLRSLIITGSGNRVLRTALGRVPNFPTPAPTATPEPDPDGPTPTEPASGEAS